MQDDLRETCHSLHITNAALRAENQKLVALEEQARLLVSVHVEATRQIAQGIERLA